MTPNSERAGTSLALHARLLGLQDRTSSPRWTSLTPLSRFVDGVAIAVDRGTRLAEVLRAQAVDVREAGRGTLLESAGKREIAMMVASATAT